MDNQKTMPFILAIAVIFASAFLVAIPQQAEAADVFLTNATNSTLNLTVLSGGNFTINVTFTNLTVSGNTTADENNGTGAPINVTLAYRCERSSSFTDLATRLNTSANQTQFSFGINTSTLEDCNMTFRARGFNDTAGGTLLRTGEVNRSDVYINNSVLTFSITTAANAIQKSTNGSFVLDITTGAQASNATATINGRLLTLLRTNTSGMAWNSEITQLPEGTYIYTVNVRDLANDLISTTRAINIQLQGGGGGAITNIVQATSPQALGGKSSGFLAGINWQDPKTLGITAVIVIGAIMLLNGKKGRRR